MVRFKFFAFNKYGARVRVYDLINDPDQCGFASSVGSQQTEDTLLWHAKGYISKCLMI